ncbi:MAG: efflux RND transporter periplasmic adaptor subunit [Congregibacter sp.]
MAVLGAKKWMLATLVVVLGVVAAWGLLVGKPKPAPQAIPPASPPLVQFIDVQPGKTSLSVSTQGSVQAEHQISLTAQVGGRVEAVSPSFVAGGFFNAGETLVQLEKADYELAIARARSQVAAAARTLAEEEGLALQAKREWRDLGGKKANALFLREPQLAAAKAALSAAEADLHVAELNLQRTSISLPFNGRIVSKAVDVGQFLGAGASIGMAYGTDRVQVRLPITDRQLALLDLPMGRSSMDTATLPRVDIAAVIGGERWHWEGRITRTEASIDVDSRVLYAVAVVEKPFAESADTNRPPLTPGLFVEARIEGKSLDGVVRLPRTALQSDGTVMLVDAESRLQPKAVKSLYSDGRSTWLTGLSTDDRVVVQGESVLFAGMNVTALPAQQLAAGAP